MTNLISNLTTIDQLIQEMHSTTSMNEKREILRKYKQDEFVLKVLQYTYNPYKKYGIHAHNLLKNAHLQCEEQLIHADLFQLLDDLSESRLTGHAAIEQVNGFLAYKVPASLTHVVHGILSHDLNLGITATTIAKEFPGLIPVFSVALAQTYEEKRADFTTQEWYASRKLDGVRCICRKEGNTVTFFSRNGKEFETLGRVAEDIRKLPGDFIFDGEICIIDQTGKEDFQGVMKEIRRKNHTIENPKYLVFDCLSLEEFDTHGSIVTLSERLNRLPIEYINPFCWLSWDEFDTLAPVEQILIETEEQFTDLVKDAELNGYEGIMIRRNAGYEGSRSHNLLKVKKFTDAEYTVISCDMGPIRWSINGENLTIDCLTNVNIMHKGTVVSVGSGFTREQREYYYAHPEELIGKTICVKYFEESLNKNNQYSLRFPVVKHIYENGREF